MLIKDFKPFDGVHCETTATGCLTQQLGLDLSEPMLFGLGEGLGFIFWNMKIMNFPFIGGRTKPMAITTALANNLGLELEVKETASRKKAWDNVKTEIDQGHPVGLQLDCFHLEYFGDPIHFAGHFAAIHGYDDDTAYMVDTQPSHGATQTSLKSLADARAEKGPMAAKSLSYTLKQTGPAPDLAAILSGAIARNARGFLNPPIKNFGYAGIAKTAVEIKKWFKNSSNADYEFTTTAMIMEKAGTGGGIFRYIYADFLNEAHDITGLAPLKEAATAYALIAKDWTQVANLFETAGKSGDPKYIDETSDILKDLSKREQAAMSLLNALDE